MADHTEVRSKTATLATSTVDSITLTNPFKYVEVTNLTGTSTITFSVNGVDPTVEGDDFHVLPAAISAKKVRVNSGSPVIKLISAGTMKYHVVGLDD